MPLQHYLPATYLAFFSADLSTLPRRRRILAVGDKKRRTTFSAPAGKLGARNDFYTFTSAERTRPNLVDSVWEAYEGRLAEAIDSLIDGTLSANVWTRTLVPFVAGTLVRGFDFNVRFERRLPFSELSRINVADNTNQGRLLELQRLLAPVLAADWEVYEAAGPGDLIVGDVCFAPYYDSRSACYGIAIPLSLRYLLCLKPRTTRAILRFDGKSWRPIIRRNKLDLGVHLNFAKIFATYAVRFIFGSDKETVSSLLTEDCSPAPEPGQIGFIDSVNAIVHEFTWHSLVSMLEGTTDPEQASFNMRPDVLKRAWFPPTFFPTNLPGFDPGLALIGRDIIVHLYEVSYDEIADVAGPVIENITLERKYLNYTFVPVDRVPRIVQS
jgi:hypothetical protein